MKRFKFLQLYTLGFFSFAMCANDYINFDRFTYEQVIRDVELIQIQAPLKDKYMKDAEYKELYNNYIKSKSNKISYKYNLGPISIGCNFDTLGFCYNVDEEQIQVTTKFSTLTTTCDAQSRRKSRCKLTKPVSNIIVFSRKEERPIGVQNDLLRLRYYDTSIARDILKGDSVPVSINEIRQQESSYSAYILFSLSKVDKGHSLSYTKPNYFTGTHEISGNSRALQGDYIGVVIEKNGNIIHASDQDDEEPLPIYKVAADYPTRALEKGVEGYAIVSFTVTESGSVEDAKVIEGYCGDPTGPQSELRPCNMFDSSAARAAEKFKYKPKRLNNTAIKTYDVTRKFTYAFSD